MQGVYPQFAFCGVLPYTKGVEGKVRLVLLTELRGCSTGSAEQATLTLFSTAPKMKNQPQTDKTVTNYASAHS